jgi:hypothetical protein
MEIAPLASAVGSSSIFVRFERAPENVMACSICEDAAAAYQCADCLNKDLADLKNTLSTAVLELEACRERVLQATPPATLRAELSAGSPVVSLPAVTDPPSDSNYFSIDSLESHVATFSGALELSRSLVALSKDVDSIRKSRQEVLQLRTHCKLAQPYYFLYCF